MIKKTILLATMIFTLLVTSLGQATAWNASNLDLESLGSGDYIWNYDFDGRTVSNTNVDWPADMIFFNNAEIDKVKNQYYWGTCVASNMDGRMKDDSSFVWDSDMGTKKYPWAPTNTHMRIYADSDDRMYNTSLGYYVWGTSHYDFWEGTWWQKFGHSENAEAELCDVAEYWGALAYEDSRWLDNYEPFRVEGNHIWDNNGYASEVLIP